MIIAISLLWSQIYYSILRLKLFHSCKVRSILWVQLFHSCEVRTIMWLKLVHSCEVRSIMCLQLFHSWEVKSSWSIGAWGLQWDCAWHTEWQPCSGSSQYILWPGCNQQKSSYVGMYSFHNKIFIFLFVKYTLTKFATCQYLFLYLFIQYLITGHVCNCSFLNLLLLKSCCFNLLLMIENI